AHRNRRDETQQPRQHALRFLDLTRLAIGGRRHDIERRMLGAQLYSSLGRRCCLGVSSGLEMREGIKELVFFGKDVTRTETLGLLDVFDRLCGSSAECVNGAEQSMCIGGIGASLYGLGERRHGRLIVSIPEADKSLRQEGPGLVGIAGEGTVDAFGGCREGRIPVLPSLE